MHGQISPYKSLMAVVYKCQAVWDLINKLVTQLDILLLITYDYHIKLSSWPGYPSIWQLLPLKIAPPLTNGSCWLVQCSAL